MVNLEGIEDELANEIIKKILERIVHGYDGLIRSFKIENLNHAEIVVSVKDIDRNQWTNLRFI